ncbi:hypothetical protein CPLU01_08263 [Colletotrichum plurivorum]|uniref:Uncharacterized protein n=1 Tax=Colletotrichum plurivorum TaxID=2175906 RepID=A0A8H6KCZ6_9PEZI|nr:hypothetical protein CPLU01_08263 [Colletotrichum plurivorum]
MWDAVTAWELLHCTDWANRSIDGRGSLIVKLSQLAVVLIMRAVLAACNWSSAVCLSMTCALPVPEEPRLDPPSGQAAVHGEEIRGQWEDDMHGAMAEAEGNEPSGQPVDAITAEPQTDDARALPMTMLVFRMRPLLADADIAMTNEVRLGQVIRSSTRLTLVLARSSCTRLPPGCYS